MTTEAIDCKTLSPAGYTQPVYHPCWGRRALPSTLQFSAGPSTPTGATPCPTGWPTTVITGTLNRVSPCSFAWSYSSGNFAIIFTWTRYGPPLSCSIDQAELFPAWSLNNVAGTPSGSCSQNSTTGVVTLTFTGTISNGLCTCPVTVTFSG